MSRRRDEAASGPGRGRSSRRAEDEPGRGRGGRQGERSDDRPTKRGRGEARPEDDARLPVVALVGRPNVGKSSLFNRLVGGRPALVEDMPGVTRDRRYGVCDWGNARFRVCDTGGLDPSAEGILRAMRGQTLRALDEAAVAVLVVDAVEGVTAVDQEVAALLRRSGKPVVVAANKVDSGDRSGLVGEMFRLGFSDVFGVSATHGRGSSDVLDAVVAKLPAPAAAATLTPAPAEAGGAAPGAPAEGGGADATAGAASVTADGAVAATRAASAAAASGGPAEGAAAPVARVDCVRLAFVGKPNVGKSSLVNRLLGEERVLVHAEPGTTRDPIDTPFASGGREFVLVDTAGMRRRRAIDTQTEAVAAMMARDQVARADVAALVIDAREGATTEDARIAGLIEDSGRAALIVLNKTDAVPRADLDARVQKTREEIPFLAWAPVLLTSALTGRGVLDIPARAGRAADQAARRVPTGELNRLFEEIISAQPPPAGPGGRHVRLYYVTQAGQSPPTFYVSTNQPAAVGHAYRRFLANRIRKAWGFEGAPIRVVMRAHRQKRKVAPPEIVAEKVARPKRRDKQGGR